MVDEMKSISDVDGLGEDKRALDLPLDHEMNMVHYQGNGFEPMIAPSLS